MTIEYNAEKLGNMETTEGRTGRTSGIPSNDIRHDSMNFGSMHFGSTGADNDNVTPSTGERLIDLVVGAPVRATFEGVGEGQQEPKDGKSQNS